MKLSTLLGSCTECQDQGIVVKYELHLQVHVRSVRKHISSGLSSIVSSAPIHSLEANIIIK